jgi:hypothetical protein
MMLSIALRATYRDVGNAELVGNIARPTRKGSKAATAPLTNR